MANYLLLNQFDNTIQNKADNLNENKSNTDDAPESSKNKKYSVTISDIIKK